MGAVFFTLILLTGNTMAQAVRERIPELAVLKTIGFSNHSVLALVLAEAIALLLIGATVGLLLLLGAQPMVAVGFLILAVCPGAPYGPPFAAIAKGNVPVAVGLMLLPGLAVTAFGLTSLLSALGEGFEPIRWVGVAYLVYLGVMQWHAPPPNRRQALPSPWPPRAVYGRGSLVCLTHPGVLLFRGSLPQPAISRHRCC